MSQLLGSLSRFWNRIQWTLFPFLEEELEPLTPKQQQLVSILEMIRIEEYLASVWQRKGRPMAERSPIARAFVAKAVYNMDSTRNLLERLKTDTNLRRICGWENIGSIPSESTFSRAFAEFAASQLLVKTHDALIQNTVGAEIVSHNSRDSTAIEGWEKPMPKKERQEVQEQECVKKKKGRPKKGEEKKAEEPTRLQKQLGMT